MRNKLAVAVAVALALGAAGAGVFYSDNHHKAEGAHSAGEAEHTDEGHDGHGPVGASAGLGDHDEAEGGHDKESLIELSDEQIAAAGIELADVEARTIRSFISLPGEVRFDATRTAHVVPASSGVVDSVLVELGETVKKGQVLAVVASAQVSELRSELAAAGHRADLARTTAERERRLWQEGISAEQDYLQARQSLQEAEIALANAEQKAKAISLQQESLHGNRYNLLAPFDGTVVEKHLVPGEVVGEASNVFTVADMSRVWVTFNVSPRDLERVQVGQPVRIIAPELSRDLEARVTYVSPLLGEQTRTALARISLDNSDGAWRPGLFVSVSLVIASRQADAAIPTEAVQELEGKASVFVRTNEGFEVRPVRVGATSEGLVDVVEGLFLGERVATNGSFILKSELGKGSAEHAH